MDKLSAISGASQVIPAYGVSDDIAYLPRNLAEIFILHVFTIAAFFFLLQYISVLNRKMDAVSELTGASKGTVAFYLLLERLVLSLITALCAAVIHRIFYSSIFERFNLQALVMNYGTIVSLQSLWCFLRLSRLFRLQSLMRAGPR